MHYRHALFLFNGNKNVQEKDTMLKQTMPILATQIKAIDLVQTESEQELKDCCQTISQYDLLILYGGDGTLHTAVNELAELDDMPPILLLPGGTCNDFSRTLGLPQNLKKFGPVINHNETTDVDITQINNHFYTNFAGMGLITDASEGIDQELKESFGTLSYFISAIQSFQEGDTKRFYVKADGEDYEIDAAMLLVMNGSFIGTHHFPIETIDFSDERLDIVIVEESNMNTIKEWLSLKNVFSRTKELSQIRHFQAKNVVIESDRTLQVDTDGENYIQTPAHITAGKKKLTFITSPGM
ncbi:diacylglycerol/lipid kinase family protein [Alkalibacillus salilacus]|uniref:YegS/Rv2252/BmrU family lipid kinase n=1 Tax=Alkalibacillus salilacus TaxID=284582 RepID=A0ABT9VF41_9BACI|nr:diacylglycerol kinase family protein [Alkalibacillus salilacus]MDQ0159420.1 YegS/Rv2252/BmrU family lipid kinase [Alkalibacillus salilacus]